MQQTIPSYEPHKIIEDYLNEENHLAVISVDGGSSLLSYMIAIGMCFDIHRQTSIAKYNQIN